MLSKRSGRAKTGGYSPLDINQRATQIKKNGAIAPFQRVERVPPVQHPCRVPRLIHHPACLLTLPGYPMTEKTEPKQTLKVPNPFLNRDVQPLPPQPSAQSDAHDIVHVSSAKAWWLDRKNQVICGLSAGALLLLGLTIKDSTAPVVGQYAPQTAQVDKSALVSGAIEDTDSAIELSLMQVDEFQSQLLSQEAKRIYAEAEKQTIDPNARCYRQSIECPLDQFTLDAVAQIEQARNNRDWQAMMIATMRVKASEIARSGGRMAEPEVSLTQVAIADLVEHHQILRAVTAEAKADEFREAAE
ncbi:MAG: hypothetical protein AAF152_09365 [Cyanobacteria bacterium P01_A01_bin.114]